jgi:hypothetical protein
MKLTDEELKRLAAEKVMGWQVVPHQGRIDEEIWILPANGAPLIDPMRFADFRPLDEWKWAGLIVEKMRGDGCLYRIDIRGAAFWRRGEGNHVFLYDNASTTRAITIAALLEVGAITEDQV